MANELQKQSDERVIRVKSSSDCTSLSRSIIKCYEENPEQPITLRAVGAGALNQATKACIISNNHFVINRGLKIATLPSFIKLKMGSEESEVTAIQLNISFVRL